MLIREEIPFWVYLFHIGSTIALDGIFGVLEGAGLVADLIDPLSIAI